MNRVTLIGRLTANPELRYTETGKAVASFGIACNTGSGEKRTTEFIDCVAWEKTAERIAETARKGTEVFVDGRLQTRKWQDKATGDSRRKTEVVVGMAVVGAASRGDPEGEQGTLPRVAAARQEPLMDVDDIPF